MTAADSIQSAAEIYAAELAALQHDRVRADLPSWLMGGHTEQLRSFVGWDMTATETSGWRVRTIESQEQSSPKLISVARVGNPKDPSNTDAYWRLERLSIHDGHMPADAWDRALKEHSVRAERYERDITVVAAGIKSLLFAQPDSHQLPEIAAEIMGTWLRDNMGLTAATMHLVTTVGWLQNRYGIARSLLHTGGSAPENTDDGRVFASQSNHLQDINLGLGTYIEPLLTSLSPRIWGVTSPKVTAVIVVCWGRLLDGYRSLSSDLLTLESPHRYPGPLPEDARLGPESFRQALKWWVSRLDLVFSHLTEPANTVDEEGIYSPAGALERMITFAQVMRSAQVTATASDAHARQLAMFNVLDSIGGLTAGTLDFRKLTTLRDARRLLARITDAIPEDVRPVVLPRAIAAVDSLEAAQKGFFLGTRLRDDALIVPDAAGVDVAIPRSAATRDWLKILRDSQHGFDRRPTARTRAILHAHDGSIPERLPDLAWLVVLALIAFPHLLRGRPTSEG